MAVFVGDEGDPHHQQTLSEAENFLITPRTRLREAAGTEAPNCFLQQHQLHWHAISLLGRFLLFPAASRSLPVANPRETRQDELRKDSKDWRLISAPETVIVYMPYVEGRIGRDLQFVSADSELRDSPKHTGNLRADTPRVHLGNQWKLGETSDFLASIHRYPRGKSRFSSGGKEMAGDEGEEETSGKTT
ncbi:hypothetical protein Bbelb_242290 [Branchiostoma belcheri]|nr:hypothetical protein Bbelb_242290 [Branchiostoma belcheri]